MDRKFRYILCLLTALACAVSLTIPAFCDEIETSAKSAIVYCPDNGEILYAKDAYTRRQMASTTKIKTTVLTIESGDLDRYFAVDREAIMVEGSSMGLLPDDIITKRMLCYGMMLPSGNDAANAAAISVGGSVDRFVQKMNEKAKALGLDDTNFVTPSGLDDYTDEHYSTAYDMARLTAYALENDVFRDVCSTPNIRLELGNDERALWLYNTNRLLSTLNGCIGVKTGFTDKAGRCLITACERNGVTLICVTLGDPNDWQDHVNLYNKCFSQVCGYDIGGFSVKIPVVGGNEDIVTLKCEKTAVILNKGENTALEKTIIVPRFIYAPVSNGTTVGKVIYKLNGEIITTLDLMLSEDLTN